MKRLQVLVDFPLVALVQDETLRLGGRLRPVCLGPRSRLLDVRLHVDDLRQRTRDRPVVLQRDGVQVFPRGIVVAGVHLLVQGQLLELPLFLHPLLQHAALDLLDHPQGNFPLTLELLVKHLQALVPRHVDQPGVDLPVGGLHVAGIAGRLVRGPGAEGIDRRGLVRSKGQAGPRQQHPQQKRASSHSCRTYRPCANRVPHRTVSFGGGE